MKKALKTGSYRAKMTLFGQTHQQSNHKMENIAMKKVSVQDKKINHFDIDVTHMIEYLQRKYIIYTADQDSYFVLKVGFICIT